MISEVLRDEYWLVELRRADVHSNAHWHSNTHLDYGVNSLAYGHGLLIYAMSEQHKALHAAKIQECLGLWMTRAINGF